MPAHRSTHSPRAKRLVLFVADGLRSDKFFDSLENTPHLQSIVRQRSSLSGISHTRVPTESRPGHVAMISGFYEDVSAVTRGWKENPVEFDSIFNRSSYTFGFGSPDIVPMFKRGQSYEHFYMECYHGNDEVFGNDQAHQLDLWVERQFEKFLRNQSHVNELNQDKVVFFFHLLGIDTNGHSHKPWSDIYMKNIQIVDGIVQRLETLIENYYSNDKETTYVFTADHGMTDWGSHGAGDDSETLTPLVIWGSAIKNQRTHQVKIEQADLCPLMAFFIGLEYPVNSVGRLPIDYLFPIDEDLLQAYAQNARQLLEQVYRQQDQLKNRLLFFKPYEINEEDFFRRIQVVEGFGNVYQIKDHISDFIKRIADARQYYHNYRQMFLSILIVVGFISLLCTIAQQLDQVDYPTTSLALCWQLVSWLIFILFLVERSPWTHLLYPLLVCVHGFCSAQFAFGWLRQEGTSRMSSSRFWLTLVVGILFLQTYILPFFYRWTMSIGILWLLVDALRRWQGSLLHDRRRMFYAILLIIIAIFPFLPTLGSVKEISSIVSTLFAGILILIFYYLYFLNNNRSNLLMINRIQFVCLALAIMNNALVHHFLIRSTWIHITSWILLIISCVLPLLSPPVQRLKRLILVYSSILNIYILLSTQYEALFVLTLSALMLAWIITHERQDNQLHLFTCQTILFILLAFFGTGNFASINSFDPSVVYCFLTVFHPFLMSTIILFKCILPILLVNCATAYVIRTNVSIRTFRLYSLMLCDLLALELFFAIQTEGSWLDIGQSISRYVILMSMIVILMVFQYVASFLLSYQWMIFAGQNISNRL